MLGKIINSCKDLIDYVTDNNYTGHMSLREVIRALPQDKWVTFFVYDEVRGMDHFEGPIDSIHLYSEHLSITCPCDGFEQHVMYDNIKHFCVFPAKNNPHHETHPETHSETTPETHTDIHEKHNPTFYKDNYEPDEYDQS